MNVAPGFRLHAGAAQDITNIWEYIAEANPLAAGRLREQILAATRGLGCFAIRGTSVLI
jgi:plasmid stabilization system protein ParE